jgi:murein DD-endopeptidase MepM/ murein hydrolase activator NlpD
LNIILVSSDLAKTRTLTLEWLHLFAAAGVLLLVVLCCSTLMNWVALRYADHPLLRSLLVATQREDSQRAQQYMQERLNQMAIKVGELQAQLLQLDGLGEKLAKIAGMKAQDIPVKTPPGRGGAMSSLPSHPLSMTELRQQLDLIAGQIDSQNQQMSVLEALLVQDSAKRKFMPTLAPVDNITHSSNFGWRIDPFNGERSFHEGLDFIAETGTPITAAASGTVVFAGIHPQYGKMIDIDHGNGLVSRYAHSSRLLVSEGDLVIRGQKIALVGTTGRSTGPHLHFEVRLEGVPQNPARFLSAAR